MADSTSFNVTEAHITRTPGVRGGKPCIAVRGIKVQNVYIWHELMDMSADEIAIAYDLTLAQIYAALTYAFEHLDGIKADIEEDENIVEQFKKEHADKIVKLPNE